MSEEKKQTESKLAEKLEKTVTFGEEELEKVKTIQNKYLSIQQRFGQIAVTRIRLNQQADDLVEAEQKISEEFSKTQKEEQDFLDEITKTYGNGSLNMETGIFTKN
jgi:L-lysine 2,3-aminomutase|tara:strand:+ start:912 stop:1229 length:318 start_codon:yes stop_codon:yes gene_type:complete